MTAALRKTGIEIIGDVAWGEHFCQFYQTRNDLTDILVPYFKAGLQNNEFCMWITSEPLEAESAKDALKKAMPDFEQYYKRGQIEIIPYTEWYLKEGIFESQRVLNGWVHKLNQATSNGYDGLRLTGNTFWLEKKDWRQFTDYEEEVDSVIGRYKILALCTYSLEKCGASEILDVVTNHRFALIKREDRWESIESSERKKIEQARRETEERYRGLVDMSPEAIFVTRDNKVVYVNQAMLKLFGASSPEQLVGKSPFDLFHPDYHPVIRERINQLLDGHPVPLIEGNALRLDGTLVHVEVVASSFIEHGVRAIQILLRDITERKQTELKLAIERHNLQMIFDVANVGLLLVDENGYIKRVNNVISRWIGKDLTEIYNAQPGNALGCIHVAPTSEQCGETPHCGTCPMRNGFETVLRTEQAIHDVEMQLTLMIDGKETQLWLDVNADPIIIDGKRHVIIAMNNISARKQVEEALRESKEDLNRAQAVAHAGSWRMDLRHNELRWSDENHQIFGISKGTPLRYETFLDTVHPDDRDYVHQKWMAAINGEPYDIEHRIVVDEKIKWVREKAELEFDSNGTLLGGFGTTQDITEQKKKDEELQKLNRTLKALSDSSQAMMRSANESEYMEKICTIVVEDCGYSMVWIGFAENDDAKTVRPVVSAGLDKGYLETLQITWTDTERGRGPTGTAIRTGKIAMCRNMQTDPLFSPWREEAVKRGYASSIVFPLITEGSALGALNIYSKEPNPFLDNEVALLNELANDLAYGITAFRLLKTNKEAEEILKRDKETFERLVTERTAQLVNTKLELEKAKRLSDIGVLAATVAHELRNPLAAISLAISNIKRKAADAPIERNVQTIEKKIVESEQIINNLLFYSRLKPPHLENILLYTIIEECVDSVGNQSKKTIRFENNVNLLKTISVLADPLQMKELFYNILTNACDAVSEMNALIKITAVNDTGFVKISLSDNGSGIDKEQLPRVFDPFFTTKSRGTGLGLSVCSQIISMHNGTIQIESELDKGTTVIVELPKGKNIQS